MIDSPSALTRRSNSVPRIAAVTAGVVTLTSAGLFPAQPDLTLGHVQHALLRAARRQGEAREERAGLAHDGQLQLGVAVDLELRLVHEEPHVSTSRDSPQLAG